MSTEHRVPVDGTAVVTDALRTLQQTTAAGTVQTEVTTEAEMSLTISAVTVGASTLIAAATTGVREITLYIDPNVETDGADIYLDLPSGSGFPLYPGDSLRFRTAQAIYGKRKGGNISVCVITGVIP